MVVDKPVIKQPAEVDEDGWTKVATTRYKGRRNKSTTTRGKKKGIKPYYSTKGTWFLLPLNSCYLVFICKTIAECRELLIVENKIIKYQ